MAKLLGTEFNHPRTDRYWLHTGDKGQDCITVETIEDCEPAIEANKQQYNNPSSSKDGGLRKIASIPGTVIMELSRINKISFRELMLGKTDRSQHIWNRFLNDPNMRAFRTRPGQVKVK
jgi:hypothetical protein